jgi:DNA-binding FadR family transcriptional regulator
MTDLTLRNASVGAPRTKLAERLASHLSARIQAGELQYGDALGNEAALVVELGASRWTVREALQILEREGQINVRRGRYGGIFVAAPSADSAGEALSSYLEFIHINDGEIVDARRILDEAMLALALERVTAEDVPGLRIARDLNSDSEGLHAGFVQYEALLKAARSPVLQAFVRAVGQLGLGAILRSTLEDAALDGVMRTIRLRRREQIEAVIAGRLGAAVALETEVLEASARLLASARAAPGADTTASRSRALLYLSRAGRFRRPELLRQEIASDIVARGWPVDEHLGSEAELLQRYGVSRSAFREAVRPLEQIGVVEMRSGRQAGLKTGSPNPDTVIRISRQQFERLGVPASAYRDALSVVGVAVAGLAAARVAEVAQPLRVLPTDAPAKKLLALGDASGNRVLSLLMHVLVAPDERPGALVPVAGITGDAVAAVIQHVSAGDVAMARRAFLSAIC